MYPKYCQRYKKMSINELGDYYERIGFVKEKSYYSIKHLKKKKDLLLLATKLVLVITCLRGKFGINLPSSIF